MTDAPVADPAPGASPGPAGQRLACATYTHARRHPMVVGQIGGWTPPFQLTGPQVVVLLAGVVVESQTWRWWGAYLPPVVGVMVAVGVPCAAVWAVRRARVEGRSVVRAALGRLALWIRPRPGRVGGRPNRPTRPPLVGPARTFVAVPAADHPGAIAVADRPDHADHPARAEAGWRPVA
jgi:hypothetical protein